MDFETRREKAIERGRRVGTARQRADRDRAINEQELQRLHSQYRLELSERIERCLQQVADRFPGFQFQTIVGERGWGAVVSRDDLRLEPSRRATRFSRLEMVVRPLTESYVLELAAKGTIHNKEVYNRSHYQRLAEVDLTSFTEMIDNWTLEYAELFATKT